MARITVKHRHGQSFSIHVRGFALVSDEPVTLRGDDEGPTPTELMVAGLAACAADEVVKSLGDDGLSFDLTEVGADFGWDADGGRVAWVRLSVTLPEKISESTRQKLQQAMLSCPARKMLAEPPNVEYELTAGGIPTLVGSGLASSWPDEAPPDVDSQQ
ncbi:MAG TPA: OsmC family protein [Clostridia bacterium]|nr:OsmC family protein [Clostridia bacterium]